MPKPLLAVVATSLLAACASTTKERSLSTGQPAPSGTFQLASGAHSTKDIIDATARYLGVNILANKGELEMTPQIDLQSAVLLRGDEVEQFVGDLLWTRSLALVPRAGSYEVISMVGSRGREVMTAAVMRTPEEILLRPSLRTPVTTTISLKHINANIATNALRPFFAQAGMPAGGAGLTFGTAGSNDRILISGFQNDVARAIELVRANDQPPVNKAAAPSPAGAQLDDLAKKVEALEKRIEALEKR